MRRGYFKKVDALVASAHFLKKEYHVSGILSGWQCIEYREKKDVLF